MASDNSSIPPPPPALPTPMGKSSSGVPTPQPPPARYREPSSNSIPAPPPGPPPPAPRNPDEVVRFAEGVNKERYSGVGRKATLLARVRSTGKNGKGIASEVTFFEDFDLRNDPLADALKTMQTPKVDDPTLLGNKFAHKLPFEGDLSTGEGAESTRLRPVEVVERILNDHAMSQHLLKFLKKEVAHESYVFYMNVVMYKKDFFLDMDKSKVTAMAMYEQFIKEGGEDQINIPSGMVSKVRLRLNGSRSGDF